MQKSKCKDHVGLAEMISAIHHVNEDYDRSVELEEIYMTKLQAPNQSSTQAQSSNLKVIAIDGPAGAGKSSVSLGLAERLGFIRLDTGALYRAIALAALRKGLVAQESEALMILLDQLDLRLEGEVIYLSGQAESDSLRTPEVSRAASDFATLPSVRAKLLDLQREIGRSSPCIVDGRDIGTIVFPDAPLKIYLTASAEARATRRLAELKERGIKADFEQLKSEIIARDEQDQNRTIAPLRCADDAQVVDATDLTLAEVIIRCAELAGDVFSR